jgi:hypothetical protein
MGDWTEKQVETHLREAATRKRNADLEEHRPETDRGNLPADAVTWLSWLEADHVELVRARAEGSRWKMICWRFGISRATAYRRWRHALRLIAWRLNGNALPTGCSRRHFMRLATARV